MLKTTTVRPLVTRTGSALANVWRRSAILARVAALVCTSHCSKDGLACGYRVQYSLRRVGLMILMCRHYVYTCARCQRPTFMSSPGSTPVGTSPACGRCYQETDRSGLCYHPASSWENVLIPVRAGWQQRPMWPKTL